VRKQFRCFAVSIMIVAVVCIAGCAGMPAQGRPGEPTRPLRFVFITTCAAEDFFKPVRKGMHDAADRMAVQCIFTGTPEVDIKAQAEMVRQAVAEGYDGIALNIIDPVAFDGVVAEGMGKGVPVVAFNVDDNKTPNARLSAVCQDFHKAGRILGERAAASISDHSTVLVTVHSDGISALEERLQGEQEALKAKGVTWERVVTGTTPEGAAEVIASALKANPQVKVILCTGQADTQGAGMAIERHFAGKGYTAAGFDLSPEILRLVKAGHIQFTIDQQPYIQGFYPVVQLALYCRYGIRPSNIDAGAAVISRSNVDQVLALSRHGYR
jgi:simple sugar transport system substrate-binding protein